MSEEVLLFQAIYGGRSPGSLPTRSAPNYTKATEELKFYFKYSNTNTYWSTIETIQSYVTNILVPYFESHYQCLNLPNQLCI